MSAPAVLVPLVPTVPAAPVVALLAALRPLLAAPVGAAFAALVFGATSWGWASGGGIRQLQHPSELYEYEFPPPDPGRLSL